jgi:signal transduction histidine kinase
VRGQARREPRPTHATDRLVNDPLTELRQQLAAEIQERKRVTRGLSAFSTLGQRLHSPRTEGEAAQIIAETARSLIDADECVIELYNEAQSLYPVLPPNDQIESRSTLSVPIRNGSRAVGVLTLRSTRRDAFGIADANTLQALADYCGGALERIHADLARREAERRFAICSIEAQEQERRRVARELHDGVNQAIASIKFRIQTAEDQLARSDERWRASIEKSKEMLDAVLEQVRRLSRNLRPGELDDLGLIPAVRTLCEDFQSRTGLGLELAYKGFEQRLPPEYEVTLYRILQEALMNIERHSGATATEIVLTRSDRQVQLQITDNGRGLQGASSGLGLHHMKERAELLSGVCELNSAPDAGLRVRVVLPLCQ